MKNRIYLDYNATAPLHPRALDAMKVVLECEHGAHNASAVHHFGREGRKTIENARKNVAALVNADSNMLIFNSGATEGNNTVLKHMASAYPDDIILISAAEHPSVLDGAEMLDNVRLIPMLSNGLIDLDALKNLLSNNRVSLVSCMFVNNESGAIQDVSKISALAHDSGALFHCDATQAVGRIAVDMKALNIDFLTFSSHKIGGPQGAAALALGLCGQTPSLLFGGGQEKQLRSGTENIAAIAGFGAAARAAIDGLDDYQKLSVLRDKLECKIKEISPNIEIHCEDNARVCNTSFFSVPDANSQSLLMAFDLENIAISNGSACSSGTVKPSKTLRAMGKDEKNASSALRISMGWATKEDDIDAFLKAWAKIYARIQK